MLKSWTTFLYFGFTRQNQIGKFLGKILMTKLRLCISNLEIVHDRYERIPREERFYKLCDSGLVEDEMFFFFFFFLSFF